MKYRTFTLIFLATLVVSAVSAKPRTLAQLKAIAARQLVSSSDAKETRANAAARLVTLQAMSNLTVIGDKQKGFVVLANDDAIEAVVGVSNKPYATSANPNPAFQWYLRAANAAVASRLANGQTYSAAIAPAAPLPDHVAPLIETKWHQEAPFNNDIQKDDNGKPYLVGCVAITMSQIMRYYKCPTVGIGSNSYTSHGEKLTADFSASTYQWDKMLKVYEKSKYTDEEAKAVSELMRQVGISVNMKYEPNFSSSFTSSAQNALIKYFGYNPNMNCYTRNFYSEQEWMDMVFSELSQHRPIYYSGNDRNWKNGHAFVIDGYDKDGKVHVNWGWGGFEDGYFDIGILTPKGNGDYSYKQDMIIDIQPAQDGQWKSHLTLNYDNELTIEKFGRRSISVAEIQLWNVSSSTLNGEFQLVIEGNGILRDLVSIDYTAQDRYWKSYKLPNLSLPTGLPDGDYKIYPRFKDYRDADWQIVRAEYGKKNSVIIHVANGIFDIKSNQTDYKWLTGISSPSAALRRPAQIFDMQGRKIATGDYSNLNLHGIFIVKDQRGTRKVIL
ncbi:C10 family peptidase [Hallella colorans]|uniref:C10 family peptidase n=1 Tax=Hallella colorans TaxID=1703337 RepID=UPI00288B442E|nr:C10 family peptidase [Hallella colorans]